MISVLPSDTIAPEKILAEMAGAYYRNSPECLALYPITQGASGRTIVRIVPPEGQTPCIGIHWTGVRPDNAAFITAARFLKSHGLRVPALLAATEQPTGSGAALAEDLGDQNLLGLKSAHWATKSAAYGSAMEQVHLLHSLDAAAVPTLQQPFDASLYLWEQEYFAEHVIASMCGQNPSFFLENPARRQLAEDLATLPRCLIHRDFQSQNIHIIQGKAWLIDFQGMRYGLAEYDLASLIYDPYAGLSANERDILLSHWERITGASVNRTLLQLCALQRIMQATAAFARYGLAGHPWYAAQLKPALDILRELSQSSPLEHLLVPAIHSAYDHLPSC